VISASGRRQRLCVYAIPELGRERTPCPRASHRQAAADATRMSPVAAAA
jgi:hypothetical protein